MKPKLTKKSCLCEACIIEGKRKPNEATSLVDGMGLCEDHKRMFDTRLNPDLLLQEEEDEWN